MKTFEVPGMLKRPEKRKPMPVSLYIEADDLQDALFQAHHGVIQMNVEKYFPGATIKYDLRKMRLHSKR